MKEMPDFVNCLARLEWCGFTLSCVWILGCGVSQQMYFRGVLGACKEREKEQSDRERKRWSPPEWQEAAIHLEIKMKTSTKARLYACTFSKLKSPTLVHRFPPNFFSLLGKKKMPQCFNEVFSFCSRLFGHEVNWETGNLSWFLLTQKPWLHSTIENAHITVYRTKWITGSNTHL